MQTNQAFTILQNAGGVRAARIITENRPKLTTFAVRRMAKKLRRGVPVAKIIHRKWFYGLPFYTNAYTLDPRPDTETLVSAVISDIACGDAPKILDLGTGTGCIIAAIIKNSVDTHGVAVEKSWRAARVAKRNFRNLKINDRIKVRRASFEKPNAVHEKFDVIVSNPPYIARGDTRVDAGAMHDPKMALYAADDGFAAYQAIAQNARKWIRANGKIYLEIGMDMGRDVRKIFESNGWKFTRRENDLSGTERVLIFEPRECLTTI